MLFGKKVKKLYLEAKKEISEENIEIYINDKKLNLIINIKLKIQKK